MAVIEDVIMIRKDALYMVKLHWGPKISPTEGIRKQLKKKSDDVLNRKLP